MAPTNRRRAAGRTTQRSRNGADSDGSFSSSAGLLPPIGEDAELAKPWSVTSTGTHFSESPDRKASRKKSARTGGLTEEEVERKKRRALALLEELEAEGAFD